MLQEYFSCEFCAYEDGWDGEEENETFGCSHPKNNARICLMEETCDLEEHECFLLDQWKGDKA